MGILDLLGAFRPERRDCGLAREQSPPGRGRANLARHVGSGLSEWYALRLTDLWIRRGDIDNAHCQINEGVSRFYDALFAANGELVPDLKWRLHCAKNLPLLPRDFPERLRDIQTVRAMTPEELERRKRAFKDLWDDFLPHAERILGMKYEDFKDKV